MTIESGDLLKSIQFDIPYYGIYIGKERSKVGHIDYLVFDLRDKRMCYHQSMWSLINWWEKVETNENK